MSHIVGISENLGNCSRNLERLFSKSGNSIKNCFLKLCKHTNSRSVSAVLQSQRGLFPLFPFEETLQFSDVLLNVPLVNQNKRTQWRLWSCGAAVWSEAASHNLWIENTLHVSLFRLPPVTWSCYSNSKAFPEMPHHQKMRCDYLQQQLNAPGVQRGNEGRRCTAAPAYIRQKTGSVLPLGFEIHQHGVPSLRKK